VEEGADKGARFVSVTRERTTRAASPGPAHADAVKSGRAARLQRPISAREKLGLGLAGPPGRKGKFALFIFFLSFLYLFVFKLFQIKFFKPIQNKTNISTPQNKINTTA
jgi:hypothetical protein